jgi:uncharacterized protein YndB with AHSA1/START domain
MSTDRIEKSIALRAPRSRVWRALSDPDEFGRWFGARLTGAFTPGAHVTAQITTPGHEHITFEIVIEKVEPENLLAFRWHPYAVDPMVDYASEPTTLVEFHLADVAVGTALTIVESGFDQIPLARRSEAFRMNEQGWTGQVINLERYVAT